MACCTKKKTNRRNNKLSVNRIDIEAPRLSLEERTYYKNLFYKHSENDAIDREKFPELLGLLGTDISVNFATRIFDIFCSEENKMWLEDYLKYIEVYHHGNERERCLTTFRLMDENRDNKIIFKEFESYIDLIIGAIKKVHPGAEDDVLTSKDIKLLFNKISNNKEIFTYQDFENIYFKKPHLLSWIDYFKNNDTTFLINLDRSIKVLTILLQRFNLNMSKLFENILEINGNTFNFQNGIKEIDKFCKAVEKIRKHFLKANSDFNIRNFFDNIAKPSDDEKILNTNHFSVYRHYMHDNEINQRVKSPSNLKTSQHCRGRDTIPNFHRDGMSTFSIANQEEEYIRTDNISMSPNYIRDQFSRLKKKIQDDNYGENLENSDGEESPLDYVIHEEDNENSQSKSHIINDTQTKHSNLNLAKNNTTSKKSANDLNVISEEDIEIDNILRDVEKENSLGRDKIGSLLKCVVDKDNTIPHLRNENDEINMSADVIRLKSPNEYAFISGSNGKNGKSNFGLLSTEPGINKSLDLEKYNEEIRKFVSKMIEMFENNNLIVNWLDSSYKWIQDKFLSPVIKKEKKKEKVKETKVNKPISEAIKKHKISKKDNMLKLTDENFAILLNMIMGIQLSVNSTSNISLTAESDLCQYLHSSKYSLPSANFNSAQLDGIFYIVTYGPVLFNILRKTQGIDKEVFIQSLSPQDFITEMIISSSSIIEELFSTSKSGSLFYHTRDGRYILKTISEKEYKCLKTILPKYFKHLLNNRFSLLPKFYGCYKLVRKIKKSKIRFYFLVMDNVFSTSREIQIKYDIKGSKIGREVLNKLSEEDRKKDKFAFALKDLDLDNQKKKFCIGDKKDFLINQIKIDSDFLRHNNIVDYSLLIGIHKKDEAKKALEDEKKHQFDLKHEIKRNTTWKSDKNVKFGTSSNNDVKTSTLNNMKARRMHSLVPTDAVSRSKNNFRRSEVRQLTEPQSVEENDDNSLLKYSVSTKELNSDIDISTDTSEDNYIHPFKDHHDGGTSSLDGKEIYYFGIIDILIQFNAFKKLEYCSKLIYHCSNKMSVVPPHKYRDRFVEYNSTIFYKE